MELMIPAGSVQLEASLRQPKHGVLRGAAVLCHPHPLHGGTMDNRVVYRAGEAAMTAGFAALRFNFRGVGASTGFFEEGIGESEDVSSVITWLENKFPDLPLALIGYSFGAWVGLQVGCLDPRIKAMTGIGIPLDSYDFDFLYANRKPALLIVGSQDQFCSQGSYSALAHRLPETSQVYTINGADHFFSDDVDEVQHLIADFFSDLELK
jgi:alpha/beta superfamily hydrolase